jgi:hypothetical protein
MNKLETLQAKLIEALQVARNSDKVIDWEVVEELQFEINKIKEETQDQSPMSLFCEDNPSASECKVFDV